MKKLLFILLLAISYGSFGQAIQFDTTKLQLISSAGYKWYGVMAMRGLLPPADTTNNKQINSIASIGGVFYIKNITAWQRVATGGAAGISQVVAGYALLNVNDSTLKVDSAVLANYFLRKTDISVVAPVTTIAAPSSNPIIGLDNTVTVKVDNITALQAYAGLANNVEVKDSLRGGIFHYYASGLTVNNGTVFAATGRGSGYWQRIYNTTNSLNVHWFNVLGDGTDESAAVQAMFNTFSGNVDLLWPTATYRFYGVTISNSITNIIMNFDKATWAYPLRNGGTSPTSWYRYNDPKGLANAMLTLTDVTKIFLKGRLTFDGEARLGNSFNSVDSTGGAYAGQGLAPVIYVKCGGVNTTGNTITYTKTGNATWVITSTGFTTNQVGGSFTSGTLAFSRNPYYHYRLRFRLTIRGGTVYYNSAGSISHATTASGDYEFIIAATSGAIASQTFWFFGNAGTNADVDILGIDQIDPLFQDTYVRTEGKFTMYDHGFGSLRVTTINDLPGYNNILLRDWVWDNTPVGGHQVVGYHNNVLLDNYKFSDPFAKTWVGFGVDGARGTQVQGYNTQNPLVWPVNVTVSNIYSDYAALPSVNSGLNILYDHLTVNKYGLFIAGDFVERNLGDTAGGVYALPLPPGGEAFKLDPSYYSADQILHTQNVVFKNTSTFMNGASRVWHNTWQQTGFKNSIYDNCIFDSYIPAGGKGDADTTTQSWALRINYTNSEFKETANLGVAYATRFENCKWTRIRPQKTSAGGSSTTSNVDYIFPAYSDLKLAVYLAGALPATYNSTKLGTGDAFEPVVFKGCLFSARSFFDVINDTKVVFDGTTFENGTNMILMGNAANTNFNIQFKNCARLVIATGGVTNLTHKAACLADFTNCEIIISGYTGTANLDDPTSSIRKIFDATTYTWNNLKLYNTSGTLLATLVGFQWLREPSGTGDYGLNGSYYETSTTRYDYTGTYGSGGVWTIVSKTGTLANGDFFVGNSSNLPVAVAPTGDVTFTNAGVFAISSGVIVNADVNAAAAIAYSKLNLASSIVNGDITNSTINLTTKVTGTLPIANGGTNNGSLSVTNGTLYYGDGSKLIGLGIGGAQQTLHVVGGIPAWVDTAAGGVSYTADESTLHLASTVFSIKTTYPGQTSLVTTGTLTTGGLGTGFVIGGVTMTLGSDAANDIYYRNSSGILTRLANGTTGQVLTATTGSPLSWATPGSGVTTVGAFNATSTANGLDISGVNIALHAADGTNPGAVTTGTQTIAGAKTFTTKLSTLLTTEQFRNQYDVSNYMTITTSSIGSTTFALVGSSPLFTISQGTSFSSTISSSGIITANGGIRLNANGDNGNFQASSAQGISNTTSSPYLFGDAATTVQFRVSSGGGTTNTALTAGTSFASTILVGGVVTEGTSGTQPLIASVVIPILTVTNGSAATTDLSSLVIVGVPTGITPTNAATAMWIKTGNARLGGLISAYNNITTVGGGIPALYGTGRATAQTAANASVATYTVGASDGSFLVSANVLVTTSSAESFTVTVSYTDEGNTARTLTLNFQTIAGVVGTTIAFANGAVPYEGVPVHLRCKASTAITIKTAAGGTYTGCTYNTEGNIFQTN